MKTKEFIVNIPGQKDSVIFTRECNMPAEECQAVKSLKTNGFKFQCTGGINGPTYVFSNSELFAAYAKSYAAMAKRLCDNCKVRK
ncbi:MAG: hypothetical protein J6Y07_02825 [Alphaproteobacteria bacterium]|nr:hypothetical protein [Alphaproteobacteria bacterium]